MNGLELKVPPPAVAVVIALVMWGISRLTPVVDLGPLPRAAGGLV